MSAETETQYNPQYGVRRTIFSDEYDFLTKIESVCVQEDGLHFAVRTWKDRTVKVCVTFLTPSVFRFVMVPELTAQSHRQTVLESNAGYLLSLILAFALLLGKKQKVQVKIKGFHLKKQMIYRIFAFGLPSFIMNALSSFVVTFVNLFLVAYSDTAIAFFGAYFKVQQLIVMTVNGLIQGCLPVMRFNYGAGNSERLHSAFRYGTVLVTGMMILGTLAVLLFPAQILGLFTASEAMRSFGISAMRIMAASYLFCGLSTMISTYFQTTEKVGSSMAIQLCRQMLFLVPALWCLDKLFQLNGIWLAFPVAETATLLVALVMMAWHRRKNIS